MTAIDKNNHKNDALLEITHARIEASEASDDDCELSVALAEHDADLLAGRFVKESVRRHMKRVTTPK